MILSRRWRHPAAVIGLMVLEFCLTVPILALFGIASPDLYRTKLWEDGADNGFNSSPQTLVYAAANYRPMDVPDVWSQFTTNFNLVISVLSTFILLTKSVMFIMHTFIPLISLLSHALLVALYAVSVRYQTAPDTNDPDHPQNGPPWYITKDCGVASDPNNVGYCKQAKTAFILTCLML
ncbi:hypothetical protein BDY21DRAFT_278486 [Lineolata rhizophorae]|uniref:Uncharacterized protein n=1 Tax=Lineolata rhizophorae TaxID=578093 RepID=A0A6A6PBT2_9PEZI|nr:hypothetical protein BDY21DRAFT_278486 [Lineolata rhizophorae]